MLWWKNIAGFIYDMWTKNKRAMKGLQLKKVVNIDIIINKGIISAIESKKCHHH